MRYHVCNSIQRGKSRNRSGNSREHFWSPPPRLLLTKFFTVTSYHMQKTSLSSQRWSFVLQCQPIPISSWVNQEWGMIGGYLLNNQNRPPERYPFCVSFSPSFEVSLREDPPVRLLTILRLQLIFRFVFLNRWFVDWGWKRVSCCSRSVARNRTSCLGGVWRFLRVTRVFSITAASSSSRTGPAWFVIHSWSLRGDLNFYSHILLQDEGITMIEKLNHLCWRVEWFG